MRFAEQEELQTHRLRLRRITREDVPAYFRLFGSEKVARFMLWEPHRDMAQSEAAVEKVLARYAAGNCYRWGIVRQKEDVLIGIVELLRFEEETGSCSFAYMLADCVWGQGYGTEALGAVFEFAFEKLEIREIRADHFTENPASGAAMRRAGMVFSGRLPGKYEKQGIVYDAEEYRITKEQWKKRARC